MGKIDLVYTWLLKALCLLTALVGAWAIVEGWRL